MRGIDTTSWYKFQPTPPARTETVFTPCSLTRSSFQPTPPARTETLNGPMFRESPFYFNPLRPRGRRRMRGSRDDRPGKISTHSAREDGDILGHSGTSQRHNFNPLRPRGRRRYIKVQRIIKYRFQPTPPARTETSFSFLPCTRYIFQPTPPARTETQYICSSS